MQKNKKKIKQELLSVQKMMLNLKWMSKPVGSISY